MPMTEAGICFSSPPPDTVERRFSAAFSQKRGALAPEGCSESCGLHPYKDLIRPYPGEGAWAHRILSSPTSSPSLNRLQSALKGHGLSRAVKVSQIMGLRDCVRTTMPMTEAWTCFSSPPPDTVERRFSAAFSAKNVGL